MIKIGITGGIGSGKTVVSRLLEIMDIPVFYADSEAKKITATSPVIRKKLTAAFGTALYKNGTFDKAYFATIIFNDKKALEQANAIIHPEVGIAFEHWAERQKQMLVAMEAAILFESGFDKHMDRIITVVAPVEIRTHRVMERDNVSKEQVQARMSNQFTDEEKAKLANYVIINDGNHSVISQTVHILQRMKNK